MPVTFSIKNVPDETASRIRRRAAANHRSIQGELLAVISDAARDATPLKLTPLEVFEHGRSRGTATAETSADYVREDRDAEGR